jgi:UDP-N-acetylglucosamine 2-epimerase (non-hydrolysing)
MPEEINRLLTDQLADLLLVTEESALRNLEREGVPGERVRFVGNTMIDSLLACREKAASSPILDQLGLRAAGGGDERYALLTLHRPANVDERERLLSVLAGLEQLAAEMPVVFPVHPRTRARIREFGLDGRFADTPEANAVSQGVRAAGIRMVDPLGYIDFLSLMMHATLVVTDSGGIQEETTCLGVPCVTVRENTERPVTIEKGTNMLAGVETEGIRRTIRLRLQTPCSRGVPDRWDGQTSARIVQALLTEFTRMKPATGDSAATAAVLQVA